MQHHRPGGSEPFRDRHTQNTQETTYSKTPGYMANRLLLFRRSLQVQMGMVRLADEPIPTARPGVR